MVDLYRFYALIGQGSNFQKQTENGRKTKRKEVCNYKMIIYNFNGSALKRVRDHRRNTWLIPLDSEQNRRPSPQAKRLRKKINFIFLWLKLKTLKLCPGVRIVYISIINERERQSYQWRVAYIEIFTKQISHRPTKHRNKNNKLKTQVYLIV